jgi:cardiolipin-specific phospholipase
MVRATAESADPNGMPLVCLHGFAHGTSCFYTAAAPLAEAYAAGPVFILDMPGCGLSSRPAYAIAADPEQRRLEAENFFCDELEAWRKAMGIERMVLAGHSVGGHSAFAYAERHPERVERLVLISPAGVPRPPKDFDPKGNRDKPLLFQLAFSLWERGYSPLSMVRTGAGWGPGRWLVNSYVRRRLGTGATWSHVRRTGLEPQPSRLKIDLPLTRAIPALDSPSCTRSICTATTWRERARGARRCTRRQP